MHTVTKNLGEFRALSAIVILGEKGLLLGVCVFSGGFVFFLFFFSLFSVCIEFLQDRWIRIDTFELF